MNIIHWYDSATCPPPAKESANMWDAAAGTSKTVLTYSKDWGMVFGRYHNHIKKWTLDGIHGDHEVLQWTEIKQPTTYEKPVILTVKRK